MSVETIAPETKPRSMARYSVLIFIFLLSAKLLNFVKKILIGQLFGVGATADAFFAAAYLPYYLAVFFEGAIFLAFLPAFAAVRARAGEEGERRFVGPMAVVFGLLCLVLVMGMNLFSGPILAALVPGFKASQMQLALPLLRIMSWVLFFISLCTFFQALNSYHRHYLVSASSGFVDTAGMIVLTLASWKAWGIYGAAWGSVFGAFLACLTQAVFYGRSRNFFSVGLSFRSEQLLPCLAALVPLAVVWTFQQVPLLVLTRFGSGMWRGTISALNIAQTLTTVPMGLVSRTVLLSVFPFLVQQAHEETPEAASATFFSTLRASFVLLVPAGLLLSVFAKPITVIFFSGGGIDPEGSRRIAHSLVWFGWSLFVLYADLFASQSLIAVRSVRAAIWLSLLRASLAYTAGYYLAGWWDYEGIAFSFSLALAVNFFVFFPLVFRLSKFEGDWGAFFVFTLKLLASSLPLVGAAYLLNQIDMVSWLAWPRLRLLSGSLAGILMLGALYAGALRLLKVREASQMTASLAALWPRRRKN